MPAETWRHDACWMAWPKRRELWGGRLGEVYREYALVARTIARFEPVIMVVDPADLDTARLYCGPGVRLWPRPIDDSWMRDSGPTFLLGDRGGLAIVNWGFNAWGGKYAPFAADAALKAAVADAMGLPLMDNRLIAEGGAILSDGEGTIITTESCLLHPNRNAGLSRGEIEQNLLACLGAEKVLWLPGDPDEIETDGHVDCLVSIVSPGRVMVQNHGRTSPERRLVLRENVRALELAIDAKGRRFEILQLVAPPEIDVTDARLQPAYVNFYLANGAVIMPGHGAASDDAARDAVAAAFPDRDVVQLELKAIPYGGGNIHCITQHQPSRVAVPV